MGYLVANIFDRFAITGAHGGENKASIEALLDVSGEFDLSKDAGSKIARSMACFIADNWRIATR